MANPFKIFTISDWISPSVEIGREAGKIINNMKGASEDDLENIDPELLRRIYEEQEQEKISERVAGKVTLTDSKEQEWLCGYCGTPQPVSNRKCDSCGGNRSFARR